MKFKPLFESFAKDVGFIEFQKESFNRFIESGLQQIFDDIKEIRPDVPDVGELVIKFGSVRITEPMLKEADGSMRKILPMEARLRGLTYSAPIYVEMTPFINKKEYNTVEVQIGELPIMVKSKYCPLSKMTREELIDAGEDPDDPGGYFIVNGNERVLVLIEEIAPNRVILEKNKDSTYPHSIRINSERNGFVQRHSLERKRDGSLLITFGNITRLPVFVLLKLLGMESDREIIERLSAGVPEDIKSSFLNEIYANLYGVNVASSEDAYEFIGRLMRIAQKETVKERVNAIVDRYLLPHLGQEAKNRKEKALYLALAIRKLVLLALGRMQEDDLDHYMNKRLKLSGDLLGLLLRSRLAGKWGLIARVCYSYQKLAKRGKLPSIQSTVESNLITSQLVSAMGTGLWVGNRSGVSQRLERENYIATLSHLRTVSSPLTSTQEHFEARELHATQFGRLCPAETPEGPTIGLRKALALLAEITNEVPEHEKRKIISSLKLSEIDKHACNVFLDGNPIGSVEDGKKAAEELRNKRRAGLLSNNMNVCYYPDINELRINTDAGRLRRPLIVVENGESKLKEEYIEKIKAHEISWNDLVANGIIEYVDAEEEENLLVSLSEESLGQQNYTHLEISPLASLGLSASLICFPEHNRGDRVNYGAKMMKQSIGLYSSNYHLRSDTKSNILSYPQAPIVESQTAEAAGVAHHPAGQNVVVAIITYHGYNMEDAIVMNKASIERGLFRSTFFRFYSGEEKRYWGGQEDVIGIPDKDVRGYRSEEAYSHLGEDGVVNPEHVIKGGDVLIGRTSPLRFLNADSDLMAGIGNRRETSICIKQGEEGIVDRVFLTESVNGNKLVKISVRDERIPEIGDKFASRHGQKGVIGLIAEENDMPFTSSGIVPDILVNPHSFPSRQTVGQLLEMLGGKLAALSGKKIDASAFSGLNEKDMKEALRKLGFRSDGKEVMYSGTTGEMFEAEIFTGIAYYQKLYHMVADKIQSRSRGPVALLTKQPTEGRAKGGGLRLGEMEKDCLIAHGAALALKERFSSDKAVVPVCKECGLVAIKDRVKNRFVCPLCKSTEVINVEMAYAFKLMLDELKSMGIYPKLNVGE